jgi:hypothetical protein
MVVPFSEGKKLNVLSIKAEGVSTSIPQIKCDDAGAVERGAMTLL